MADSTQQANAPATIPTGNIIEATLRRRSSTSSPLSTS
jgi:hypothetical protein